MITVLTLGARKLLDAVPFGRPVTLRQVVAGTYDPLTGGTAAPTVTDHSVRALVESFPMTENQGTEVNEQSIRRGDVRISVIAADVPVRPNTEWIAIVDAEQLRILDVDVVNQEFYVLQARR